MNLTDPRFQTVEAAREWLEMQRWPDGPHCTHCGSYSVTGLQGRKHRPGVYQCNDCREQFTVTTGSVMERSKIPLNKWLLAMHLMASSKKGYSAHQLHRTLGITYQSAWFLAHRIREAMSNDKSGPLGGEGKIVEVDETYFGDKDRVTKRTKRGKSGLASKRAVVSLVERGGRTKTFHVERATIANVREVVVRNVSRKSTLHTDESRLYTDLGTEFASHASVRHSAGLQRSSLASLSCRIRFPLFKPVWRLHRRYRTRRPYRPASRGQAPHLSADSLSQRRSGRRRGAFSASEKSYDRPSRMRTAKRSDISRLPRGMRQCPIKNQYPAMFAAMQPI